MKKLVSLFAGLALILNIIACDKKDKNSNFKTIDPKAIQQDASLTKSQRSDKLTEAAEELMTPTGFVYAEMILDMALAENPENKKAQFYKNFLQIKAPLRGLYKRIKPLAMSSNYAKKNYENMIKDLPASNLKNYLFDSASEDIKTESDLQDVADKVYAKMEKFRQFLKSNKDLNITLRLSEVLRDRRALLTHLPECGFVDITTSDVIRIKDSCKLRSIDFKVNRADVEALIQITAAYQIYGMMGTSYDISALLSSIDLYTEKKEQGLSRKDFYENLAKNEKFGVLRKSNTLKSVLGMGSDLIPAMKWVQSMQSELCKETDPDDGIHRRRRPGHLFYEGICLNNNDDTTRFMAVTEALVGGQQLDALFTKYDKKKVRFGLPEEKLEAQADQHKTKLLAAKLFTNPIVDIKQQQLVFNSCDEISGLKDQSINGAFVLNDANKVLKATSQCETP